MSEKPPALSKEEEANGPVSYDDQEPGKSVCAATPDDFKSGPNAPPSFEEVMGQNLTSFIPAQPELPPLCHIDIMPMVIDPGNIRYKKSPVFQPFSSIITGANVWLQQHPELLCWKCETVERKIDSGTKVNLGVMTHYESAEGFNAHVMGLRIWFVKKMDGSPPQQLGVVNVVPEGGVTECVSKVNTSVRSLPGAILNIETATLKYSIGYSKFDPECTCYCENGADGLRARKTKQIMRVFYLLGHPMNETVCMKEIQPRQVRFTGTKSSTKFEPFSAMVEQARMWLQSQSGIRVVNIETRDIQSRDHQGKIDIFSEKTDDFLSNSDCIYVRVLRIFYVNTPEVTSYAGTVLSTRLFVPQRGGEKGFENMNQTMGRIVSWLASSPLPIFSVETVSFPVTQGGAGLNQERVDYGLVEGGGKRWLTAIRLYFPVLFQEQVVEQKQSSTCTVL
ncbi:uncharacterized protein LOC124270252 [Haliotis rubra]|uniref:uncharacterized protein LOC124270252 n=1 Tax=Haliotis rubra TaxID=36100 RepID=UPI001EE50763|nr:uncharacterized protein LOC124270252 [Haliotis rubra]